MFEIASRYRASGANLPFSDPLPAHGVDMEGYFWRFTLPRTGEVVIALCGVNRGPERNWSTVGLAGHPGGFLRTTAHPEGSADPSTLGASAGMVFRGEPGRVRVDLGPDAMLDARILDPVPWPRRRLGGSSLFHSVPGLNQYWHPWLLGGRAQGHAVLGGRRVDLTGAQVYAEKNWGRAGFPDSWWWGQAQGFAEAAACVAFAGGQVHAGPLRTEATSLVVRLPDATVIRLCNPITAPVSARVTDETWSLRGRNARWSVVLEASSPLGAAHVLPVPLPAEQRNVPGAIEHLAGALSVTVRRAGHLVWQGNTDLAALEHGGIERARAEVLRRGGKPDDTDARPI